MWECAIDGCEFATEDVDELLYHQAADHERHQCAVCGTVVPDGYFAIHHAFTEHTRAEYVRAYDADSEDIRTRETIIEAVEAAADIESVVERIGGAANA